MPDEKKEDAQTPPEQPGDWFLAILVKAANSGLAIGITVQVAGFLVSGTLIGGAEYFEGFAQDFSSAFQGEDAAEMRQVVAAGAKPYKAEGEPQLGVVEFIHIRNARFFTTYGTPIPANRGVWWRGRLSEVSGFVIGSLAGEATGASPMDRAS